MTARRAAACPCAQSQASVPPWSCLAPQLFSCASGVYLMGTERHFSKDNNLVISKMLDDKGEPGGSAAAASPLPPARPGSPQSCCPHPADLTSYPRGIVRRGMPGSDAQPRGAHAGSVAPGPLVCAQPSLSAPPAPGRLPQAPAGPCPHASPRASALSGVQSGYGARQHMCISATCACAAAPSICCLPPSCCGPKARTHVPLGL